MKRKHDDPAGLALLDAELLAPALLHELRQPLMGADAAATLLERAAGPGLAQQEAWRILRSQLARMGEVVNGYDELFRAGDAEPVRFAVAPVVARAVDLLALRVRPLGARFAFAPAAGLPDGFGAPGALVHAATNLIANALDAVDGVGPGRVEVRVIAAAGEGIEVRVSDAGTGIPAELRERIFEPRFTTKAPGHGTGLGLHISRRLMSRFGGAVTLVDAADPARLPWAVTEFCVSIPAAPAEGTP
ncbi:histidine kinase [Anaeromyxobacter dehalogenans 2CP-1]|uniref:histidine kinase n=1 Tax=Anaeromyxobacter dehalogenans (strain ATCC BAA-258 / DSM 21875 / 2CP-1) TaxID=455488 RepID=B8JBU0_ANAD2|nr:HAMP domain-containing sensor histidine kinase [Anaeromyxobacter dehalogenans]ACL67698.1 histidine kinase [Anaeromyxobacter dehalogenans 2CP-1]